jgi:hypothetical protein
LLFGALSVINYVMPKNRMVRYRATIGLLLVLLVTSVMACSVLPWKRERSPYTKEEVSRLSDKDIYIIDGEKYLKVPSGTDEQGNVQFHYVKVDRYLAGEVEPLPLEQERVRKEETQEVARTTQEAESVSTQEPVVQGQEVQESPPVTTRTIKHPYLKRKIAILPFEDRTQFTLEKFGEVIADRLTKKMEDEVFTSQVIDREMVRLTLARSGLTAQDLSNPSKTTVLNKTLGIQGVIVGTVYGPFVTTTDPVEYEKTSMAIVKVAVKFIDTSQGRVMKEFVATNPLGGSEEFGELSEERAKYRAVDLAVDQIIAQLVSEIQGMDWLTRIALVEGNTVYLNAGNRTGLKAGDLLEVYSAGDVDGARPIGRIKVSKLFGVDAAVAQVIRGRVQVNAVVKPLPQS